VSAGPGQYADCVAHAVRADAVSQPSIAVCHSMAGLIAPLLPERLAIERLVLLGATVPVPLVSYKESLTSDPRASMAFSPERLAALTVTDSVYVPWEVAQPVFFHGCSDVVGHRAWELLRP
jgi:hypothetical protein